MEVSTKTTEKILNDESIFGQRRRNSQPLLQIGLNRAASRNAFLEAIAIFSHLYKCPYF
jgi:hypothetical protein